MRTLLHRSCLLWILLGPTPAQHTSIPIEERPAVEAIERHVRQAAVAARERRRTDVISLVESASRIAGDSLPRRKILALALLRHDFPDLVIQLCRQTLQRAPEDPLLHGILGTALMQRESHAEAAAELERAIRADSRNADWWGRLARVYVFLSQNEKAQAAVDKALELRPGDAYALGARAELHYRNMEWEACVRTCIELLAVAPDDLKAVVLLARSKRTLGHPDEALSVAEEGLRKAGAHGEIHLERGVALLDLGRTEEAARALEQAAALLPEDARPHLHLAKAYTRLGLREKAIEAQRAWQRLRPKEG